MNDGIHSADGVHLWQAGAGSLAPLQCCCANRAVAVAWDAGACWVMKRWMAPHHSHVPNACNEGMFVFQRQHVACHGRQACWMGSALICTSLGKSDCRDVTLATVQCVP